MFILKRIFFSQNIIITLSKTTIAFMGVVLWHAICAWKAMVNCIYVAYAMTAGANSAIGSWRTIILILTHCVAAGDEQTHMFLLALHNISTWLIPKQ